MEVEVKGAPINITKNESNKGGKKMKFQFIGLGAAGNKAVVDLVKAGAATADDVILVNSTDKDFVDCDDIDRRYILNPGNTGCGKERKIAKQFAESCEDIILFADTTNVVLVTSV